MTKIRNSIYLSLHKLSCYECRSEYEVETIGDLSVLRKIIHECNQYKKLKENYDTDNQKKRHNNSP